MTPADIVKNAETLLQVGDRSEAECRMVVHACYYAALHIAAPFVGVDVEKDHDRHARVRENLQNAASVGKPPGYVTMLAPYIGDLHKLRVHADYKLGTHFPPEKADQAITWMTDVVDAMPK